MKALKRTLIFTGMLVFVPLAVWANQGQLIPGRDYREGEVLVKYRPGVSEVRRDRVEGLVHGKKARAYRRVGVEKISLSAEISPVEAVRLLQKDPDVAYAELNRRVDFLVVPRVQPDDPAYLSSDQWYLDAPLLGGAHSGTQGTIFIDRDIDAPEAWAVMERTFGPTTAATVGVIDSGCGEPGTFSYPTGYLPGHEDLPNSVLWRNTAEGIGQYNVDDDANGYIDDINGWDFMGSDNIMADEYDKDAPYHGTHISGIIAGEWDNGLGIAGVGKNQVKVLPLRALFSDEIIAAIDYAIGTIGSPPVKVLNASWKFDSPIRSLQDAIEAAGKAGIAIVAAAGNGGTNNDTAFGVNRVYPAQYTGVLDNVLSVAAAGSGGNLAPFSNYGPQTVQIAAPGVDIYSLSGGTDGYDSESGTSFSAPIAASALALVMAAHPALSPAEAIERVVSGGDFDARLTGLIQSGKRVNLAGALAPFTPYSGLAPMDTLVPVSLYADTVSALYGSIGAVTSDSPSVAVMVTTLGGAWAVSPVSPGLVNFELSFDGESAPVGTYETGLWRVTGISPFSAQVEVGQSISFTSLIDGGTIDWRVGNPAVGAIDSDGLFTALAPGTNRVYLTVNGQAMDNSGVILVIGLDEDGDGYRAGPDCNDADSSINPGAGEVCNDGIDNDCDGLIDKDDSDCTGGGGGGGGGACGTTSQSAGPQWPGAVEMMLTGLLLLILRKRYRATLAGSKIQNPTSKN